MKKTKKLKCPHAQVVEDPTYRVYCSLYNKLCIDDFCRDLYSSLWCEYKQNLVLDSKS